MRLAIRQIGGLERECETDSPCDEAARIESVYSRRSKSPLIYSYLDPGYRLLAQEREDKLLESLFLNGFSNLAEAKILDVGCGTGAWLRDFIRWGARPQNLCGVDLISERIAEARRLCPPEVRLIHQNATNLDFAEGTFDLVLQSTVFTSILDAEMKRRLAKEMLRVVREGGLILWYDFHVNNPANSHVRGVGKAEIKQLFPNCKVSLQRVTLAPPIGRLVAPISTALYRALSQIKPLCTHYLGIITKL